MQASLAVLGLGLFAFLMPSAAAALELRSCYAEATARQLLAKEGHRIVESPGSVTDTVWSTVNDQDRGYILRRNSTGQLCVAAVLPLVSGLEQNDLSAEVCSGPGKLESAKEACEKLQAAGFRSIGSASARSETSALEMPLRGPVTINSVFCAPSGKRALCGLTETTNPPGGKTPGTGSR